MQKDRTPPSLDWLFYTIVYTLLLVAFVVTLYPFLFIASSSLSSYRAVYGNRVVLWPVEFTLAGYGAVLKSEGLWTAYYNTLWYTVVGTAFNIVATSLAAYPLSRRDFCLRRPLNFFIAFTMYFSGGLIPIYLNITRLWLYNSRWVMVIPGLLSTYNVMICRSAYAGIPEELTESAKIDGANDFYIFRRIAVRLITPTLAVLTLYYAIGHWNSFYTPLLYLGKESLQPMAVLLRRVLIQFSFELTPDVQSAERDLVGIQLRFVIIMVATLPILAIYPFIQRFFVRGVMLGAVKG